MHAGLPFHPLASVFPLLEGERFAAFVNDVRERGLLEPIVLYQEQVLDGRNRQRACLEAAVPLRTTVYEGADPLSFVLSANLHRRHMNESQRAMTANRLATLPRGRPENGSIDLITQERAGGLLDVSVPSIKRARLVQENTEPEVVAAVDAGEMTVSAAAGLVGKTRAQQLARLERDRRKREGIHRPEDDYYRTPSDCVRALLKEETLGPRIWEPACGDGAISRVLTDTAHEVISTDLIDRGFGDGGVDFLATTELLADCIVTNPPYELADEFALHALKLGVRKMAFLCRLAWLEGSKRYERLWRQQKLARVLVFSSRQTLWRGDEDCGDDDGGMTAYAWFVFEQDHAGRPIIRWLP